MIWLFHDLTSYQLQLLCCSAKATLNQMIHCFSPLSPLADITTLRFGLTKCLRPAKKMLLQYWSGPNYKDG